MPPPKYVKKRDGRPEAYDEDKVSRAIALAARDAGRRDGALELARELARSVTFFLGRAEAKSPETKTIAEAVERALDETGHSSAAERFREHREWRASRRATVRVREQPSATEQPLDLVSAVEVLSAAGAAPWSKHKIVLTLMHETGLAEEAAEDVARAVEARVFASGLNRLGSTLLRELVDGELFERGFSAHLGKLEVVGVPKSDLKRLVFLEGVRAPAAVEAEVARAALERYALDDLIGGEGAAAHRRGEVHLLGLGRPLRLAAGAASATEVVTSGKKATNALEAARALMRAARTGQPCYDLAFGLARVDRAFAPFAAEAGFGDALETLLDSVAAPSQNEATSPELVFTVEASGESAPKRRARDGFLAAFAERGAQAAGARLAVLVRKDCADDADALAAVERTIAAATKGAPVELALIPGKAAVATSRGHAGLETPRAAAQVACLNLARAALEAGRGERERLSAELARGVEAALMGLHQKRRLALSAIVRPALPLWQPRGKGIEAPAGLRPHALEPDALADVLSFVGLEAGVRYFSGESPVENKRVAKLCREIVLEVAALARAAAPRFGLALRLEDAPAGDAPERLAALDLERYGDARGLVEGRGGWDPGLALGPIGQDPQATVALRVELAQALGVSLALPRSALAAADPAGLAQAIGKALGSP
jgi:ribonucleoside-triphosphate reductase